MKYKIIRMFHLLLLVLCLTGVLSTPVYAGTTEQPTTSTNSVQTRKYNTNDDINNMKANTIWSICKDAIIEFQDEINTIVNVLVGIFLMAGAIVFVINCIRITTIEAHPLARKKEYMSMLVTVGTIAGLGAVFFFSKFILFTALGI